MLIEKTGIPKQNIYYQPPSGHLIKYPCIIYGEVKLDVKYADNTPYSYKKQYTVKHIFKDQTKDLIEKFIKIQYCSFKDTYISDNLRHDVYNIYY